MRGCYALKLHSHILLLQPNLKTVFVMMVESRKIVAYVDKEVWGDDVYEKPYGYSVYDNHPLANLDDESGTLTLGDKVVTDYDQIEFLGAIPCWFIARTKRIEGELYSSFLCGIDLTSDGKIWCGVTDKRYDTVAELVAELTALKGEFDIFAEEPMRL